MSKAICKKGTRAQSVLFHRDHWTKETARAWLRSHKMKTPTVAIEENYLRYRQEPVSAFEPGSLRTKTIDIRKGVRLIIGCPKKMTSKIKSRRIDNAQPRMPDTVVYLGDSIEMALTDERILKFTGHLLCSDVQGKTLYSFRAGRKTKVDPSQSEIEKKAGKLYSEFTDFEADEAFISHAPEHQMKKIGQVDHLVYRSDKWSGKEVEYIHEFKNPPDVWANRELSVLIVKGKIKVRKEGITG